MIGFSQWFASERARVSVLVILLCASFMLGGSSRADVAHLVVLRPIGVICAIYAIAVSKPEQLRTIRMPLLILFGLLAVVGLQLLPLPFEIWRQLPTHSDQAAIDVRVGLGEVWRPISLDPQSTANAFFALFVPLAALTLISGRATTYRDLIVLVLLGLAVASGLLGLIQMFSGGFRLLYFYPLTNVGSPVGALANRNHQAVFMAAMLVFAASQLARMQLQAKMRSMIRPLSWLVILLAVPVILASESRSGVAMLMLAAVVAGYILVASDVVPRKVTLPRKKTISGPLLVFASALVFAALTAYIFLVLSGSSPAELAGMTDETYDMRFKVLPIAIAMVIDALPFGIGIGAFPIVFRSYEPADMVEPRYLNHTHNDWIQPLIELGIPGMLLAAAFLIWMIFWAIRLFRSKRDTVYFARLGVWFVLAVLILASAVDYPLRTPLLMAVAAVCAGMLGQDWSSVKRKQGRRRSRSGKKPRPKQGAN